MWTTTLLLAALILLSMTCADSGVIKTTHTTAVAYDEYFGTSPISMELIPVLADIVWTEDTIRFHDQFGDTDTNTWGYAELGAVVASTSMAYTDSEAVFTAIGDGTNATTAWYNHTATAVNGLRLASGTKISARLDLGTGTPQAQLGLVDASAGTYFRAGYDESGNLVYNNNGTPGTIVATGSVDTHYYTVEIIAPSSGDWTVKMHNSTMVQVGESTAVTSTLTYANFDRVQLMVASTAATAETAYCDCVWSASIPSSSVTIDMGHDDESHVDHALAGDDEYTFGVDFSYTDSGISNDSSTSKARTEWGYTYKTDDYNGQLTFNETDFLEYGSAQSEKTYDEPTEQDLYAVGFNDVKEEIEASVEEQITAHMGFECNVVDYVVLDLLGSVIIDEGLENEIDEFYQNEVPQILADEGAQVELNDGTVVEASAVPAGAWAAFFDGDDSTHGAWSFGGSRSSIKKIKFGSSSNSKSIMGKISAARGLKVTAGMGVARSSVGDLVDKTKTSWASTASSMAAAGRKTISAPTNFMVNSVRASQGAMKDFQGNVNNVVTSVKENIEGTSARVRSRITASATSISTSVKSAIAGAKNSVISKLTSMKDSLVNGVKLAGDKALSAFSFLPKFSEKITTMLMWGAAIIVVIVVVALAIMKRDQIAQLMNKG